MQFLIEVIKGLLTFAAACVGLGFIYLVYIIARETGWLVRQDNRRKYMEKQKPCEYCKIPGKNIAVIEYGEQTLFVEVSGAYLRIFDDDMPGLIETMEISYCPKCGRLLRK